MIVFSNTTPLISLASVEALHLLPALFGRIHVAEAVWAECQAGGPIYVPDLQSLSWIELVPFDDPKHDQSFGSLTPVSARRWNWPSR